MSTYFRLLFWLIIGLLSSSQLKAQSQFNESPDQAQIIVDDLERFWKAWDMAAQMPEQRKDIFQREYFDEGSAGLRAFKELRIGSVDHLLSAIDAHPRYYSAIRQQIPYAAEVEEPVRKALHKLYDLLPGAVFPNVYIVIGAMTSAGTLDEKGLLIGFEMNAMGADVPTDELSNWHESVIGTPNDLPALVVHELIHYQQFVFGHEDTIFPQNEEGITLLNQSIVEGAADFLAELLMGEHPNQHIHEWALPREAELWAEFTVKMHGTELDQWLYEGTSAAGDRPADLGYFIGYKIVESYFEKADDKKAAVKQIVGITDIEQFLKDSGYSGGVDR
jgi:hypothetical protein